MAEKPKSSLTVAIEKFTEEAEAANIIRKEVITQLREDVKKMRVDPFDKAMVIQAKMSINTTLLGALKDVEDSAAKRVKMEMSKVEQESGGQFAQSIVQLLKMVRCDGQDDTNPNREVQKEEDVQKAIAERGKELGITITEGEKEGVGQLPVDAPTPEETPPDAPPAEDGQKEE